MPSIAVKLYHVFFKFLLKHRLQNRIQTQPDEFDLFGVTSRLEETIAAPNPILDYGVATKDIHIDPFTSLSIPIFLPEFGLNFGSPPSDLGNLPPPPAPSRRNSYGIPVVSNFTKPKHRRNSVNGLNLTAAANGDGVDVYRGYSPLLTRNSPSQSLASLDHAENDFGI